MVAATPLALHTLIFTHRKNLEVLGMKPSVFSSLELPSSLVDDCLRVQNFSIKIRQRLVRLESGGVSEFNNIL
jgi:hypothetical protein